MAFRLVAVLLALAWLQAGCLETSFEPADGLTATTDVPGDLAGDLGPDTPGDGGESDGLGGDATSDVVSPACPGGAACPCSADPECKSGACLDTPEGPRCAPFCEEGNCPEGYVCGAAQATTADGKTVTKNGVCLHRSPTFCTPCTAGDSCVSQGDPKAGCVDATLSQGLEGWYCAPSCTTNQDCASDRFCTETLMLAGQPGGTGGKGKFCLPKAGTCNCSPSAFAAKAGTTCGKTGENLGVCTGKRACGSAGLSACDAPDPVTETCNGADDDCDAATDESTTPDGGATPAACDDGVLCTVDSCGGKDGCVHLPAQVTCSDGNACTTGDGCKDGTCQGGPAPDCDDQSPCTLDQCDPAVGCTYLPADVTCTDGDSCTTDDTCVEGKCKGGPAPNCDDGNVCTDDSCQGSSGCVNLPNAVTCDDANACTAGDLCGGGTCKGDELACDDGWGCTADACDPTKGCTFSAAPGGPCGEATIPYLIEMSCGDKAFADWRLTSNGSGLKTPKKPQVTWALDDQPALIAGTPGCSLNVNNGKDLACGTDQDKVLAFAESPRIDATSLGKGAPLYLKLESAGVWSTLYKAEVEASTDDVTWNPLATLPPSGTQWGKVQFGISSLAGGKFRIRLRFSSSDCSDASGTGWFVRNFAVFPDPCSVGNGGCSAQASCKLNPVAEPLCTCLPGWTGDGKTCTDVDECKANNGGCATGTICQNKPGSYTCGCKDGYTGDGKTCTDIDECKSGTHDCDASATCTNTAGSFTCKCKLGFSGDGKTCKDIDECATNNGGCSKDAACSNTPGSYSCACKAGFSGDGKICTDVDECKTGADNCSTDALCTNTAGSFTCKCNAGFTGDGKTCTDIDECKAGSAGCGVNATCANSPGSFACKCNAGYFGDGKICIQYGSLEAPAQSCLALLKNAPGIPSGDYYLKLDGQVVKVYCDMTTDGGGWTRIDYKADLTFKQQNIVNGWTWLGQPLTTVLTADQIAELRALSTEGRQTYVGLCNRMVHYFHASAGVYSRAFGFRFSDNSETPYGNSSYAPYDITVTQDGCKNWGNPPENGDPAKATIFQIKSVKVPILNIRTRDNYYSGAKFGSPLLQNPAWLR